MNYSEYKKDKHADENILLTQWSFQSPLNRAGAKLLTGFIFAPVYGPYNYKKLMYYILYSVQNKSVSVIL